MLKAKSPFKGTQVDVEKTSNGKKAKKRKSSAPQNAQSPKKAAFSPKVVPAKNTDGGVGKVSKLQNKLQSKESPVLNKSLNKSKVQKSPVQQSKIEKVATQNANSKVALQAKRRSVLQTGNNKKAKQNQLAGKKSSDSDEEEESDSDEDIATRFNISNKKKNGIANQSKQAVSDDDDDDDDEEEDSEEVDDEDQGEESEEVDDDDDEEEDDDDEEEDDDDEEEDDDDEEQSEDDNANDNFIPLETKNKSSNNTNKTQKDANAQVQEENNVSINGTEDSKNLEKFFTGTKFEDRCFVSIYRKLAIADEKLRDLFAGYGEMTNCDFIVPKKATENQRRIGFIQYKNKEDCIKAVNALTNYEVDGHVLEVRHCFSRPRLGDAGQSGSDFGQRGGGRRGSYGNIAQRGGGRGGNYGYNGRGGNYGYGGRGGNFGNNGYRGRGNFFRGQGGPMFRGNRGQGNRSQ